MVEVELRELAAVVPSGAAAGSEEVVVFAKMAPVGKSGRCNTWR